MKHAVASAALAYAQQLTINAQAVGDELFARLQRYYDEGEIVEISAMAGLFGAPPTRLPPTEGRARRKAGGAGRGDKGASQKDDV